MAALTQTDVQLRRLALSQWIGARLQSVAMLKDVFQFEFYNAGKLFYLIVDLKPARPELVALRSPFIKKGITKPAVLFAKAHFVGQRLSQVEAPLDLGRVLRFGFGSDAQIEIRLFPHGQNMLFTANGRSLALNKPKELIPLEAGREVVVDSEEFDLFEAGEVWKMNRPKSGESAKSTDPVAKKRKKLEAALRKITQELENKKDSQWAEAGQWIKAHQNLSVPNEYSEYVDESKSLSWNIENCFHKSKENARKIQGTKERLVEVEAQLKALDEGVVPKVKTNAPIAEGIKTRQRELSAGIFLVVGKSAVENLKLLRAARPWYLWMHLRDQPGAHGIVTMNKSQKVSDEILRKAANFLIEIQFGPKAKTHVGDLFDIVCAQCRHVKPIKGDRLGRVNYSDARTIRHRFGLD